MKKAIYKITNLINKKIYIGQSNNPQRRFQEHCSESKKGYTSLINQAIVKYGEKNFQFEILGWFENYKEKEQYYIQYYKSLAPYGYNIATGGNEPPHWNGEKSPVSKISKETASRVQIQALNWLIPRRQIVKDNKITFDIFRHINEGTSWFREDLNYPLRPNETEINNWKAEKVINLLQTTKLSQKEIAKQVGWGRTAVTAINNGTNHYKENLDYPIRK